MPNVNDLYPSKSEWLKSDDVPDAGITVTIDAYEVKDFNNDGKHERKPVLYFKEDVKALVLNKTNATTITTIVGSGELDDWIGKKITLVPREVEFAGKQTWAIRVQTPRRGQARSAGVRAAAELDKAAPLASETIDDSDVPF